MTAVGQFELLATDGGSIAYDVRGTGPLVVCIPGMGELRQVYRFLIDDLVDAGFRVASMDLRGHGDSDTSFTEYDDVAAAGDAIALIRTLGGPAVLIGNSMGAGAAVVAAADAPGLVSQLVLIGPFVRQVPVGWAKVAMFRLALLRPWGRKVWNAYLPTLYAGKKPADFEAHRAAVDASLARPGRWKTFAATTHTSHAPAEARLAELTLPTLVVMGELDPDFPDPIAEANHVAAATGGQVVLVPEAGHYPQAQRPDLVSPAVVDFISGNDNA